MQMFQPSTQQKDQGLTNVVDSHHVLFDMLVVGMSSGTPQDTMQALSGSTRHKAGQTKATSGVSDVCSRMEVGGFCKGNATNARPARLHQPTGCVHHVLQSSDSWERVRHPQSKHKAVSLGHGED